TVRFDSLTFYEGDILWNGINNDPRVAEPLGGYFTTLTVEAHTPSGWVPADNVILSEPLDPYAYYQIIDLDFDSIWGDGIRIRGSAGGTQEFTSIVELVVHGAMIAADFDGDNDVDPDDFNRFQSCATGPCLGPPSTGCYDADFDGDNDVDQSDFGMFQLCYSGPNIPLDPDCANYN
ncbi:MAG: hypothetical protein JSV03_02850, partial [Planctomycetota bacterium]